MYYYFSVNDETDKTFTNFWNVSQVQIFVYNKMGENKLERFNRTRVLPAEVDKHKVWRTERQTDSRTKFQKGSLTDGRTDRQLGFFVGFYGARAL